MSSGSPKTQRRVRRKRGIAKRIRGTAEKPRLTVFRSLKHIYAQIIDDRSGATICSAGTLQKGIREQIASGGNMSAAKVVGAELAARAKEKNVEAICFDRNGYRYHGRIKALADAAREGGLKF